MRLTSRQAEVGLLVAKGLTNKEIARALDITEATVKQHVTKLLVKLGVPRRGGLAEALTEHRYRYGSRL